MTQPQPETTPAADPATPTPTLAETLTRMSDDIRVQMESCGRDPAGQLERAWLGLFLMIYRWLAELAGRPVPAWMEDACDHIARERTCETRGGSEDDALAEGPEDRRAFHWRDPMQDDRGNASTIADACGPFDQPGFAPDPMAPTAETCDPCNTWPAEVTAAIPADVAIARRKRHRPRPSRRRPVRDPFGHRRDVTRHPARVWTATAQSIRHC